MVLEWSCRVMNPLHHCVGDIKESSQLPRRSKSRNRRRYVKEHKNKPIQQRDKRIQYLYRRAAGCSDFVGVGACCCRALFQISIQVLKFSQRLINRVPFILITIFCDLSSFV